MPKARERRITLPDPLPSSERKPGPAERKLPSYLELSEALRAKQLISEWQISSPDLGDASELQLREALTRTLSDHVYFGYIRSGSKLPQSHPKPGAKIRYSLATSSGMNDFLRPNGTDWLGVSTAPASGNWSVIPKEQSRLYIFDFDVQKIKVLEDGKEVPTTAEERYLEVRRDIGTMERFLGVDLSSTYAQLSPSGGVHIFVLLPEGVDPEDLPAAKFTDGMRSLAGIPRARWAFELRGDIRSGASNGFILMAGSRLDRGESEGYYSPLVSDPRWSDFKDYRSGRKLRLLTLPGAAVDKLREVRSLDIELRGAPRAKQTVSEQKIVRSETLPPLRALRRENYSRLLRRLDEEPPASFHAARAQIYRALSCCGAPESIAAVCRDAGYARDSHSNRELSDEELLADIESMERRGLTAPRCGSHCGSSSSSSMEPAGMSSELEALISAILMEKLEDGPELTLGEQMRIQASSTIEARALLRRIRQRESEFGIYGKRKPRGFDYAALTAELIGQQNFSRILRGENLKIAGYRIRALELAVGYFGPLFAAGASLAIAPAGELMELFGWTSSQLREAMRLLRSSGAIVLKRRQISGKTSCYGPGDSRFYDERLSKKLKSTWGSSKVESDSGERAFLGGFFDHSRGRIVRPDGSSYTDAALREIGGGFSSLLEELNIELPRALSVGRSVVTRYLGKALVRYIEVSGSVDRAVELIGELPSSNSRADEPLGSTTFIGNVADLETSASSSGKDRTKRDSQRILIQRTVALHSGDRSPPDLPRESPPQSNLLLRE